jgi:hypothetical protein
MVDPFERGARYYDLLHQDKDSEAEVAYVQRLLLEHGPPRTAAGAAGL